MKKLLLFFAFAFLFNISVHAEGEHSSKPLAFTMHKRQFTFSTYYDIDSDQGVLGNVIKKKYHFRTSYRYFDRQGNQLSIANSRLLSPGILFSWAAQIDVYDAETHAPLGLIEGSILTLLPSKFYFYNANGELIGIAYMDANCLGFTVVDPKNEARIIASLHRVFVEYVSDHWTISIEDQSSIDLRMLISFSAFALDNQTYFREDF